MRKLWLLFALCGCLHPESRLDHLASWQVVQMSADGCSVYRKYQNDEHQLELLLTLDEGRAIFSIRRDEASGKREYVNDLGAWKEAKVEHVTCHADNKGFTVIWRNSAGVHRTWFRN